MQSCSIHIGSGISTEPTQEQMDQPILETSVTCITRHTEAPKSSHTLTLLARFGPHRHTLHEAFMESCRPYAEDDAALSEWTYNVLVNALIRLSTLPDEEMEP